MLRELGNATKTRIISFVNNKGGSGKSTCCSNLAYTLSKLGKKVLVIDGDMQLNLSLSFYNEEKVMEIASSNKNLYSGITQNINIQDIIVETPYENLDLISSSLSMSRIETELTHKVQREFILKKYLKSLKQSGHYDYILIDSPPTLGFWVMNVLSASDELIVPVEASPWGLFGIANLFDFLRDISDITPELNILGIALTKVDERKSYYKQAVSSLKCLDDLYIFENVIRVDSNIEWSQENSMPVLHYKKNSRSAKEYLNLAKEILSLLEGDDNLGDK
jgi:chromosome partitioning protein